MESEYFTPRAIRCGLNRGFMRIVDGELEKKCSFCDGFIPCSLKFFHLNGGDGKLKSQCKFCWIITRHASQNHKTDIVGRPKVKNLKYSTENNKYYCKGYRISLNFIDKLKKELILLQKINIELERKLKEQ